MTGIELEIQNGYARGWTFTPLNGKVPVLFGWQQQPRHTLEQAFVWAKKNNVGLRTGLASGIGVIDIDPGAEKDWQAFPATVSVVTGRGGWHLYYRVEKPLANSSNKIGKKIDVRGDAGQVVFVGGVHPETRHRYWWMQGHSPDDLSIAPFPWHLIPPPPPKMQRSENQFSSGNQAEERCIKYFASLPPAVSGSGGHNATFAAACVARRFGLDESGMWRVMDWYNSRKCDPQWSENAIRHKIRQAINKVDGEGRAGEMLRNSNDSIGEAWPTIVTPTIDQIETF